MTDGARRDRARRIRVWAVQQGYAVPWNRRLPERLVELYEIEQARFGQRPPDTEREEAG